MIHIALEDTQEQDVEQQQPQNEDGAEEQQEQQEQHYLHHHNEAIRNMFNKISNHYLGEQERLNNISNINNNNNNVQHEAFELAVERMIHSENSELILYKQEASLFSRMPKGSVLILKGGGTQIKQNTRCSLSWPFTFCVSLLLCLLQNGSFQLQVSQLPRIVHGWLHRQQMN